MNTKRIGNGFFWLIGLCVLALAFFTGCSSGDSGSNGNDLDNGEAPPALDDDGPPPPDGDPGEHDHSEPPIDSPGY